MPIYEYRCDACGHELDALQKLSDDPLKDCPECADSALRRLISAPSFRLKGEGWYETDFKSDKETKRNLVEAPADKPSDTPSDKKEQKKAKEGEKSSKEKPSKKANLSSDSKPSSSSNKSKDSGSAAA